MELSESEKQIILNSWSFLSEMTLEPTSQGGSNSIYFVHTLTDQFILKLYSTTTKTAQIEYEHLLLTFLQQANLSFAVPVPIPASSGETLIHIETEPQLAQSATLKEPPRVALLPRLAGEPAQRRNLQQVQSMGCALAELHSILAEFDLDGQLANLPYWGNLTQIHPLVSNPLDIAQMLNLSFEEQTILNQMLTEIMEVAPRLYATLPIQTIHADYITPNILIQGDRVTGILDFEFATRDLRLLDYLSSLNQLASFPWKEDLFAHIVRAFSTGYRERGSLTSAEQDAMISVWRLQRASSLVYWTGWLIEEKASRQRVMDAVMETLRFDSWLKDNEKFFLDCLGFT